VSKLKTQKIEMIPLYIALLNRTIKKITLYMEATMTFDTGWHENPLGATSFSGHLGSHDKVPNRSAPYPALFFSLKS
jgi:hypothetical protein